MFGLPYPASKVACRMVSRKAMCHWASKPAPPLPVDATIIGSLGNSSAIEIACTFRPLMLLLMYCIKPQPDGWPPGKM
jgi:hypothetical protein